MELNQAAYLELYYLDHYTCTIPVWLSVSFRRKICILLGISGDLWGTSPPILQGRSVQLGRLFRKSCIHMASAARSAFRPIYARLQLSLFGLVSYVSWAASPHSSTYSRFQASISPRPLQRPPIMNSPDEVSTPDRTSQDNLFTLEKTPRGPRAWLCSSFPEVRISSPFI